MLFGLSLLIATMVSSPWSPSSLIFPLYTLPKPPSPILSDLLNPFVAILSSSRVKALRLCSFSLYNSGMLRGVGNVSNASITRSDLFLWFGSLVGPAPLLIFFFRLKLKKQPILKTPEKWNSPQFTRGKQKVADKSTQYRVPKAQQSQIGYEINNPKAELCSQINQPRKIQAETWMPRKLYTEKSETDKQSCTRFKKVEKFQMRNSRAWNGKKQGLIK